MSIYLDTDTSGQFQLKFLHIRWLQVDHVVQFFHFVLHLIDRNLYTKAEQDSKYESRWDIKIFSKHVKI